MLWIWPKCTLNNHLSFGFWNKIEQHRPLPTPTLLRSGLADKPPLAQTNPTPHQLPIILISNGCHSTVNWKSTEAVPGWPVWPWCREPRCRRQPADKRSPVCRWPVPFTDCLRHVRQRRPTINYAGSWCDSSLNPNLCHRGRTCSLSFKRGFSALKRVSLPNHSCSDGWKQQSVEVRYCAYKNSYD